MHARTHARTHTLHNETETERAISLASLLCVKGMGLKKKTKERKEEEEGGRTTSTQFRTEQPTMLCERAARAKRRVLVLLVTLNRGFLPSFLLSFEEKNLAVVAIPTHALDENPNPNRSRKVGFSTL